MSEFKEREDNPLHKEYGLWSNTLYVLKKTRKYCGTHDELVKLPGGIYAEMFEAQAQYYR